MPVSAVRRDGDVDVSRAAAVPGPAPVTGRVPLSGHDPGKPVAVEVPPRPAPSVSPPRRGRLLARVFSAEHVAAVASMAAPAAVIGVAALAGRRPSKGALALAAGIHAVGAVGVAVGLHKYLTHGAFKAREEVKAALVVAGGVGMQGPAVDWVAIHRQHHQTADTPVDVHTPLFSGRGLVGRARGYAHAYAGWMVTQDGIDPERYCPDLLADKTVRAFDRYWWLWGALSTVALPAAVGYAVDGRRGAVHYLGWAGLFRAWYGFHVLATVNTVCHMYGEQPFKIRDNSRNIGWLALMTIGGSYHNGHHAEPASPREGHFEGQVDVAAGFVRLLERAGLVWDVKWPDPDRLARKLADPADRARLRPKPAPVERPWIPLPEYAHRPARRAEGRF